MADFYRQVPKPLSENLAYRVELRKRALHDEAFRRGMMAACREDVLFFFGAFCWLYEPRPRFDENGNLKPKTIPFVPWDHQIPVIREIRANLGVRDIGIEKSRGEGMSWIGVLLALHDWLFDDMAKVGLVSNTEKKADDPGNLDSLMAKIDWELTKLPRWMAGVKDVDYTRNLSDHSLVNKRNGSQINAFAATGDAGRSGRYKWFMPDELAFWDRGKDEDFITSIRSSTDSRLVISTPNGTDGAYYRFMHTPSNALRLQLHWSQNPSKNRGLYVFKGGIPVAVDPINNPLPKEYNPPTKEVLDKFSRLRQKGFKLEGKQRSPWYDDECDRADATPFSIAQELDLDYAGTMFKIFGSEFFEKAEAEKRMPFHRLIVDYNPETLEPAFDFAEDGQLLIWSPLDVKKSPPPHRYVLGADISSGLGGSYTSNSVACVIDLNTMEQVAEYATNIVEPAAFADHCMAIAKWFNDAYLIWETNFGGAFTKRVIDKKYPSVYMRTTLFARGKKKKRDIGWRTDDHTKDVMFGEFSRSVRTGQLKIRSDMLVQECGQYVRLGAKIEHNAKALLDDSSTGQAHGDRVIAACVCLQGVRDRPLPKKDVEEDDYGNDPPPGSMAYRQKQWENAERERTDAWDDRTLLQRSMAI